VNIVLCGTLFPASPGVLAPLLPDDEVRAVPAERIGHAARTADVLVPMMTRIDAPLIAATSARLIQQWGAGLEGVDIEAASARGIYVANVPSDLTANAESTAEHALLLMLGVARRLRSCGRTFDDRTWGVPLGEALSGRRALVVGFGRIGKALAPRLAAMGVTVDAVRRTPEPGEAMRFGLDRLGAPNDLPRLAADADYVVCTAAATPESRGMLNASVFAVMKRTAVLINVARGALVNEPDLIAALRSGTIAGAGLDVFAHEPIAPDHPLLAMEQVLATPHIAGVTVQSYDGIARAIAANVTAVREGRPPSYCVNLHAVSR
jgi:phosphoglycerate dehydrogenase-like enzyme